MKQIYEYNDLQLVVKQLLNDRDSSNLDFKTLTWDIKTANMKPQDANMELKAGHPDYNVGLQKKRYLKEVMRRLIVGNCNEWRTAEQIAVIVGRRFRYVKDVILPQLSDVIEKMYDIPHHPKQKYRAKQKETEDNEV